MKYGGGDLKAFNVSKFTRFRTGFTFLVVDDDPIIPDMIERAFREAGHSTQIVAATSGADAFETYKSWIEEGWRFHAIFMDIIMPEEDGFSVTRKIRQYETS
jgi:two-component system chemotaxis response regulator CheY